MAKLKGMHHKKLESVQLDVSERLCGGCGCVGVHVCGVGVCVCDLPISVSDQ